MISLMTTVSRRIAALAARATGIPAVELARSVRPAPISHPVFLRLEPQGIQPRVPSGLRK
jgi:hypothetical protein